MRSNFFAAGLSVLALVAVSQARATEYEIDKAHSKIGFAVTHMMISEVSGSFKDFDGGFNFDPDKGLIGNAEFTAKSNSVDTGNAKRDEHLQSPDFFDAAKFPTMSIKNSKVTKTSPMHYKWAADMTLHGVTKPVTLELEYKGSVKDPMSGGQRAAFVATTKINRKDFGLTWNKPMEQAGGVVVGDEVRITLQIEATEKAAAKKK